ncbi:aromatase/cyclase [Streptomyces sp. NPDC052043]|uniref:aromatase/cyclase n=1 Tax=Streptomyces sp. NPDC052043 TaxID=3365684 RepID=UPI0037D56E6A
MAAPAGVVYALLADAEKWPLFLSSKIHVERLEFDGERDRLRTWSLMDGRLTSWTVWRRLDPVERRVEFHQELPLCPPDFMAGTMSMRDAGPGDTELLLEYHLGAGQDRSDAVAWHEQFADESSHIQLADLKGCAERWRHLDELVLSFEESIRVNGPPELVYDFLYRADAWPESVPDIARVDLTEDSPGVQRMAMETLTERGPQTTGSIRICFPHAGRIIHKQTALPALLAAHVGEWSVVPDETGVTVVAQHSVVLRDEGIPAVLSDRADLAQARRNVRETLGRRSRALLGRAKEHAESAVRMLHPAPVHGA